MSFSPGPPPPMPLPQDLLETLTDHMPVLIAGPTGSGKSALALALAEARGGVVVNADALQVYREWRILTARPSPAETARVPHRLYGHVSRAEVYSAGQWLRDVSALLDGPDRPIIVGGTGLYFSALTEGLAEIPATPVEIRQEADTLSDATLRDGLDAETRVRIDLANRARLQRAWEVLRATGRGLAAWQQDTPQPCLPPARALCLVIDAPKVHLTPRLALRFDAMLAHGALDEVRANLAGFDPSRPGDKAIGAQSLAEYLRGSETLAGARERAVVATRQYAKRQRTWFRARMKAWHTLPMSP